MKKHQGHPGKQKSSISPIPKVREKIKLAHAQHWVDETKRNTMSYVHLLSKGHGFSFFPAKFGELSILQECPYY